MKFNNIIIIFEIISTFIMIISYILIIIQSFKNYNFKNFKTKDLIVERLLYEQFSNEIYSNINLPMFLKEYRTDHIIENVDMNLEVKLNSFYDCQGIFDDELNEKICQNKLINNYTCCRAECCLRTNGNHIYCNDYRFSLDNSNLENNKILLYNDEEYFEDPRRRYCTYFNKYKGTIKQNRLTSKTLYKLKYNYKDIYLDELMNTLFIAK